LLSLHIRLARVRSIIEKPGLDSEQIGCRE
jgi:hypothetical protein